MDWITAEDALERLQLRPQTLYAYVSRGRLAARADPADPRRSLYSAADIDALIERRTRGRKRSDVAAGAIAWGEPVLESAITSVTGGRLFYRGKDVVRLAERETLESVALLLRGESGAVAPGAPARPSSGNNIRARAFAALAAQAGQLAPTMGRDPAILSAEALALLDTIAAAVTGKAGEGPAHLRIAKAWGANRRGADLIRRALVLLADHELNASTFAVRVAASTGASLAAAMLAGFAALSGPRHGGATMGVRALLAEAKRDGAPAAVAQRLAEGRGLPGFGHPLYPHGDPRATALLAHLSLSPGLAALRRTAKTATGMLPNVDFALVALTEAMEAPPDAAFGLFAAGRTAGWIAHALEQARTNALIRPRARYVGPTPEL